MFWNNHSILYQLIPINCTNGFELPLRVQKAEGRLTSLQHGSSWLQALWKIINYLHFGD